MNLPLQDNGQEIKKGDTHFILHGVYHGIQWIDGEPYRPRVEMLVIKDGRQVFLRKYDEKQGHGYNYRLPGGSLDSDSDRLTQALNETNEEALLDVSNPYFTGVQYFRNYEEGFLLKGGDICIAYKGEVTEVFTSKYIGKYDKKSVDKEDLDKDMAKNGKFYYITSVMHDMSPEHLDALLQSTEVDDDIKRQIRLRTSVIESVKKDVVVESNEPKKKPVYLVSCGYNTGFSNAVKAYTKSQYNHSALSLDDKLDTMYTFRHPHIENGKFSGGFEVENLKYIMRLDKNAIIKVNVVMVEEDKFEELQRNINKLISNMRDTKYDTANLLRTFLQIEIDDSKVKDDTLTCAEFVAKMLYNLGIKISDKPLNLITPDDIANSEIAYHSTRVYMGSAKGYKPSKLNNMPATESFVLEVKRSELPDSAFGIPEERKYPLDTKEHVLSAIKLFNHVEPKYEKTLAKRIKSAINEFDIQADEIHMTEKNRLSKYITKRWLGLESTEVITEGKLFSKFAVEQDNVLPMRSTNEYDLVAHNTHIINNLVNPMQTGLLALAVILRDNIFGINWVGDISSQAFAIDFYGYNEDNPIGGKDNVLAHGAPVYSINTGKVIYAGHNFMKNDKIKIIDRMSMFGNAVIIAHTPIMYSLYAHLDSVDVKPGQDVKKGQFIGRCGTTGNSDVPHLHFQVCLADPTLAVHLGILHQVTPIPSNVFLNSIPITFKQDIWIKSVEGKINTLNKLYDAPFNKEKKFVLTKNGFDLAIIKTSKRKPTVESLEFTMEAKMPTDELNDKIEKLIRANNKDVATFGREAKLALLNGFGNMNDLFIAFNTVLFLGGLALALCIPVMVTILITYVATVPYGTVTSLLLKQKKLIDSNIKKLDRNGKTYKSIVDKVIESNGELHSMMESYTIVMEAPGDPEEEESTDYTAEVDDVDMDDTGDDLDEEESTDYTEEVEDEEVAEEDTDDETTEEDETEEETEDEAEDEELEEEESTDYTEEVEGDEFGDETSEDTTDDNMDTSDTDETVEDSDTNKNTIIKNYNLMVDFQKMFRAISDILVNLEPVIYTQPIQNSVLSQVIKNLRTIKDYVVRYVDFNFSDKYEENLYYYGIFLQAMKFNLEILRKNDELDNDN